ncbi:hypothetical protein [Actinocorallia sp. A-T 12471]|uniref:hypothetical protein n=1 Tax=Actinocorallia sp. A-T 12471 TaxID=3089813 RepID=UPI0029D0D431|nr:hypothetical protein [Actinocorallia sp. A-T 12471]MDX6742222.1 hypothetical protein [Actinocorallia sp. A-T 12471]
MPLTGEIAPARTGSSAKAPRPRIPDGEVNPALGARGIVGRGRRPPAGGGAGESAAVVQAAVRVAVAAEGRRVVDGATIGAGSGDRWGAGVRVRGR